MTKLQMTIAGMALAGLLTCGPVFAQPAQDTLAADPSSTSQNSIKLSNVFMALPAGEPWLWVRSS
jgi:hypothetical protein